LTVNLVFYFNNLPLYEAESTTMKNADLLITNARIWNDGTQTYSMLEAGVSIQNGKILEIEKSPDLAEQYSAKQTWNAGGKLLLPGLINTHCHLFQVFMRGLGKDLPFLDWVHQTSVLFGALNLKKAGLFPDHA